MRFICVLFRILFKRTRIFLNASSHNMESPFKLPKGCYGNAMVIKNAAGDEKSKIVPTGYFPEHPDGAHEVTREHLEQMVENLSSDLMVDRGHEAIWHAGAEAYGWISQDSLEVRDDGLYAEYPDFTPDAKQMVTDRKFRFLSPAYSLNSKDKSGREIGATLWPISLTNTPYFDKEIDALRNSNQNREEQKMNYTKEVKEKLGLTEAATDQEVDAKLDEVVMAAKDIATEKTEQTEQEKTEAETEKQQAETEVVANAAILKKIDERLKVIETKEAAGQKGAAEALVNSAVEDGKILPAVKEIWVNSATADYDGTKTKLDALRKNSAMPGKTETPKGEAAPKVNSTQAATDFFKAQGRIPGAQAN